MLNQIYKLKEELSTDPKFIDLMTTDFSSFYHFDDKLLTNLASQYFKTRKYIPDSKGLLKTREGIYNFVTKYTLNKYFNSDNIFVTASTSESYSLIFKALIKDNEKVILPKPVYPLFESIAEYSSTKTTYYDLNQQSWQPDITSIEYGLKQGAKLIVIVTPNNPTGSVIEKRIFLDICDLASKYKANILIDEVFNAYSYESKITWDYSFLEENPNLIIFKLNGISKLLALPDLKLAWIELHANQNNPSIAAIKDELEVLNDTFLNANYLTQSILPSLLTFNISNEILKILTTNRDYLNKIKYTNKCKIFIPKGGVHCVIEINNKISEEDFVIGLLNKYKIFVHPGYFYEFPENNSYIVISLLNSPQVFKLALDNLINYINTYG